MFQINWFKNPIFISGVQEEAILETEVLDIEAADLADRTPDLRLLVAVRPNEAPEIASAELVTGTLRRRLTVEIGITETGRDIRNRNAAAPEDRCRKSPMFRWDLLGRNQVKTLGNFLVKLNLSNKFLYNLRPNIYIISITLINENK